MQSGFTWGFLGAVNVRPVVGEAPVQTQRSCPEQMGGMAAPSPAGSVGCGPKWVPRVGGNGWLGSTSQLKVATVDLRKQREPKKKERDGATPSHWLRGPQITRRPAAWFVAR